MTDARIMADDILSSPTTAQRKVHSMATVIPLDSPSRQRPLHPELGAVKVPLGDLPASHYHPVTCEPFTVEDLQHHKFQALLKQYGTPEEARKAQEDAIREVKQRLEEAAQKTREVEKEMEEKEKTRNIERKAYQSMKQNRKA
jgi:hypothetical protein